MFLKSNVYMPTYERYLEPFRGRNVTMLEIGIFGGGSLASFVQPTAGFINLVDVTELATLDGIDEDLAEAIVAHRATNGHFASPRTFKTSMA